MPDFIFTPAAQRALDRAADWTTNGADEPIGLPAALMGLLLESECRAAEMLRRFQVGADDICRQWPALRCSVHSSPAAKTAPRPLSIELIAALSRACQQLAVLPQPLELATEHILLAFAEGQHEMAIWLAGRGLHFAELLDEIYRLHGYSEDNLVYEIEDPGPTGGRPVTNVLSDVTSSNLNGEARIPELSSQATRGVDIPTPARLRVGMLRIIDAAANRAREGLRVVEDYVRFVLDDRHLTGCLKSLRHEFSAILDQFPATELLACRDTQADVGTSLSIPTTMRREDMSDVLTANFKRLQESLRSLEECSKTINPRLAGSLEQIRYRSYTLERAVFATTASLSCIPEAALYVLIDGRPSATEFEALASAIVSAGAHVVQLRDKRLEDRELLARARRLRSITQGKNTLCIINDRPDLAALAAADGVHVGQDELGVREARQILGPRGLIGVSTHSLAQARQAVLDGADYIGVGPTFPSGTKSFAQFTGLELLTQVQAEIRLPAFAIGGITAQNLPSVRATGFRRIAVSGAVQNAADPAAAVAELLRKL